MKQISKLTGLALSLGLGLLYGCTPIEEQTRPEGQGEPIPIRLTGEVEQINATRVDDSGFCDGDQVGIYVVDYDKGKAGALLSKGNRADNVRLTFDEKAYRWDLARELYFRDQGTAIDIYGYYPLGNPTDVTAYTFEVQKDQGLTAEEGALSGYEGSDFLWGKSSNVMPTDEVIRLGFRHIMSGARVTLREGSGFGEGEWLRADKKVLLTGTRRKAQIDLSSGQVTAVGDVPATGTIPLAVGDEYRAIVVPQTVSASTPIARITVDGSSYLFRKDAAFDFLPGKLHSFTITVNKCQGGGVEFVVTSESITAWQSDPLSHDGKAREYIVIDVPAAGGLKEAIAGAGKDLAQIKNLKLTGKIGTDDYKVMRDEMPRLANLNLKEVESRVLMHQYEYNGDKVVPAGQKECFAIPELAFACKESLMRVVFPDRLEEIGRRAFYLCGNLTGSLVLPEGLERIASGAFFQCLNLTGRLYLPRTLVALGRDTYYESVFYSCPFTGDLILPTKLEYIGHSTFKGCTGLGGELRIPESVTFIGDEAFFRTKNLRGDLIIPQGVTVIGKDAFYESGLDGNLVLHDGITKINEGAFSSCHLKGELSLPKDLEIISPYAFGGCDFSGKLIIPERVTTIARGAFWGNRRLSGEIVIPSGVETIGSEAFARCSGLEGIVFEDGVEMIGKQAFLNCFGIGSIVSKSGVPPMVSSDTFDGVPKDNVTLEVQEGSIATYGVSIGWKDFKRIAAYRNFVIRPQVLTGINSSVTRTLILNADEPWEVESKPDWVTLSQTSGEGKAEIRATLTAKSQDGKAREGEVVFKMRSKDYRTRCRVTQYDYKHGEDEILTLQRATQGKGVNLVILGDGFSAKDISEGKLESAVREAYKHFFGVEPYRSYKEYFNVYSAVSVSQESGVGTTNTIVYNRFNTSAKRGVTLGGRNGESDTRAIMEYACKAPTVSEQNLHETLIIMIPNTTDYGGICYMYDDGEAIAYCPMSNYGYPFDFRGVIQHEAGGHGFGKLGDEYIYHNAFIDDCICTCCPHVWEFNAAKANGWYGNLSLSGKRSEVPWSRFLTHDKYKQIVDVFEGGYMHSRGVYRSEHNSCMNNDVPYYSTVSREEIVKRIMRYSGETYSFADFVSKDKIEPGDTGSTEATRSLSALPYGHHHQHRPVFMGKRPRLFVK